MRYKLANINNSNNLNNIIGSPRCNSALTLVENVILMKIYHASCSQARKRKIAILKAQGENVKAISELVKYLKDFMADGEAWMELCDLYILEQDYAKASFCCEELILQHPHNHLYYQRFVLY